MKFFLGKKIVVIAIIFVVLGVGLVTFFIFRNSSGKNTPIEPIVSDNLISKQETIGLSVEKRKIEAYSYLSQQQPSDGEKTHLLFVGGIHGGYEWNSVLLTYNFIDYLKANPKIIPPNMTISIIPTANPDGVYELTGKEGRFTALDVPNDVLVGTGRFNANNVDLNRNFDCKWQTKSTWRGTPVSAGTAPFSEPEAVAIKNFVLKNNPDAVVFWHSQSNAVYASKCENEILPETLEIMKAYSNATKYPAIASFDAYEITGDAEGWLASIGIPAITVELKTHEDVEWEKNLTGIKAIFKYYENKK